VDGEQSSCETATGILVIVPRDHAARYASLAVEFDDLPGCQIIVDRREAERRRRAGPPPRRAPPGERRTGHLEHFRARVVVLLR
jgi:hypothetical protein